MADECVKGHRLFDWNAGSMNVYTEEWTDGGIERGGDERLGG